MSPQKKRCRPKKRTLVRWDENLNELLLLTIQSVCNANSVKIPWADVAKTMGHNATEGAIVQHLAKLRSRRINAGKDVPPPLRRGSGGAWVNPIAASKHRDNESQSSSSSDEDLEEDNAPPKRRELRNSRALRNRSMCNLIKLEDDSDESTGGKAGELLVPGAKFLELPGDKPFTEAPKKSKIIVLKYRKPVCESWGAVLPEIPRNEATQYHDTSYEELCQQFFGSGFPLTSIGDTQFLDASYAQPIMTEESFSSLIPAEENQHQDPLGLPFDIFNFPGSFSGEVFM